MLERIDLKADQMYRLFYKADESDETFFYTPDGVGGFWYDTEEEMLDQHGFDDSKLNKVISAQIPSWF